MATNKIEIAVTETGTAAAAEKVRAVQRALQAMNRQAAKVQVDADTAGADAKLRGTQARVREVSGKTARVKADADTAGADTKLAGTRARVGSLDGKTARVNVDADVNAALAKIALVGTALAAIGGGGLALGALGMGAAAAGGLGIGAMAVGLTGVGDAVRELGTSTSKAGGAARGAARDNLAMASALDQVESAERRLSSARLDAADSDRRSREQVRDAILAERQAAEDAEDAERDLNRAQRDAADAQRDVNEARRQAKRDLADLAEQVDDMGRRERGAALDVKAAKEELDRVRRDRRATDTERERAQLAYEEALDQQDDLKREAGELADTKAEADRKGVEGSDRVREAQERATAALEAVTEAQARVRDSIEAVAEAHRDVASAEADRITAARHAAEAIADAQQGVVEAHRAVERAAISAGGASGGAAGGVNKLKQAMDNLSPAGQKLALFLRGFIDGPLREFQFAVQEQVAPAVEQGLRDLTPHLKELEAPFAEFSGKVTKGFFAIAESLAPLAGSFLEVANVALEALEPLKPVLDQVVDDIVQMLDTMVADGTFEEMFKLFSELLQEILEYLPEFLRLMIQYGETAGPSAVKVLESLLPLLLELGELALPAVVVVLEILNGLIVAWNEQMKIQKTVAEKSAKAIVGLKDEFGELLRKLRNAPASVEAWMKDIRSKIVSNLDAAARWIAEHSSAFGVWGPLIDSLARTKDEVFGVIDRIVNKIYDIGNAIGNAMVFPTIPDFGFPGFANGGVVGAAATGGPRGNLVMVGERGRELVRLPYGSQVMNNGATERAMGGGGGARNSTEVVTLRAGDALTRMLFEAIRSGVRQQGGNVQLVLGT